MRHAEKEKKGTNPSLSAAGMKRAAGLREKFAQWTPDAFYSTQTKRTMQTLEPWAKALGKEIQTYDAGQQEQLASQLKGTMDKTIIIVGHSNTIPQLANLLVGSNTYTDLPEDEYTQVWIISIEHGHASAVVRKME